METLTLTSPIVMVVVGVPGSGKSYFAERFADTFGAAIASPDRIRWMLFSKHTYSKTENEIVSQMNNLMIEQLLRTKRTFVIDGGFNRELDRRKLAAKARKAGYKMLVIVVQTDTATIRRRALHRSENNPGDKYKQSLTPEQLAQFTERYEEPRADRDNVIVISGKHNYDAQARNVLKRIVASGRAVPTVNAAGTTNVANAAARRASSTRPARSININSHADAK